MAIKIACEQARWRNGKGGVVVLRGDGQLVARMQAKGDFVIVADHATLDDAALYVANLPGVWRSWINGRDKVTHSISRTGRTRQRKEGTVSRTPPDDTQWREEIERRIAYHSARVEADLRRLGEWEDEKELAESQAVSLSQMQQVVTHD